MRKGPWIKVFLGVLLWSRAFALNMDSIPVWNPDYLVRNNDLRELDGGAQGRDGSAISGLSTHGYKTMQVTVGDGGTQVDQELRLSIQGFVGDSVYIDALLSDVDRRAGDQTTATLQEVDQIYFRAESRHWMVHLGDLIWRDRNMGLFGLERASLGAMIGLRGGYTEVRGVAGTDETNRIVRVMNGVSGQRDGYSISDDGSYLSVVPGSERVYLNGNLLTSGVDYEVNYAGGLLNFKGRRNPGPDDEIRVEYDSYDDGNIYNMYAAHGAYRHPNLYLDVSGFRLENDRHRMKRGLWTDEDYQMLKHDDGSEFIRDDSLGALRRPERTDRAGARLRFQGDRRFYADLEMAINRTDSNTVSRQVDGPEGYGYRWYVTSDSSENMKKFPLAFSVYGNYIQEEFGIGEFQGSDKDWDCFRLLDEWDLDSAALVDGDLRHDEFGMRLRLATGWLLHGIWGYRQGEKESWNSSRGGVSLIHKSNLVKSDVGAFRVESFQEQERVRYQSLGNVEFLKGLLRPFGNFDLRYTESDSLGRENQVAYGKTGTGIQMVGDSWNISEGAETKTAKRKGDTFGKDWRDSLQSVAWIQSAAWQSRYAQLDHFLQYERRSENGGHSENSWVGDFRGTFGHEELGLVSSVDYKLGLTEEQTYTPIYKAVAKGTGDVRYDSLTGSFIEGVDNGDFVYEGMGRNDSLGAILASNAAFRMDIDWSPGISLGIRRGILRDISLGGTFDGVGEDTTGKKIYFPPATPSQLREISSGTVSYELRGTWAHPRGVTFTYKPGADYDKKLSSISYFETRFHHLLDAGFQINDAHFVGATLLLEDVELKALQVLDWDTRDISGRYRFDFWNGFFVQPGGRYRTGEGEDDQDYAFDAYLWEGSLRLGYNRRDMVDGFVQFSVVQMESGDDLIPYQMMDGYSDGRTYRLESSVSVDINDFISCGLRYVLRFGDAEENIFQKLTTEARAFF